MGLEGIFGVIVLSVLLLVCTFAIGLLPLYWISRRGLDIASADDGEYPQATVVQIMSQFGVGMLLGTSFMLVIPEGVTECLAHDGNVGLNLLLGYLAVYLLDRLTHILMQRRGRSSLNDDIIISSWKDLLTHPKQVAVNILKNNVVFALFIHGISDGVALGTAVNNQSLLIVMLLAIVIHKIPAVLSLSSLMISRQNLPKWEVIANLFAFASSTPLGYIILSIFNLKHSETMSWLSGNLLLMSGGSLLYAAFTAFSTGDHDHVEHIELASNDSSFPIDEMPNVRSYKIVQNQSTDQINHELPPLDETFETTTPVAHATQETLYQPQLKYDKSVYILCGVFLPVIISFIIKE